MRLESLRYVQEDSILWLFHKITKSLPGEAVSMENAAMESLEKISVVLIKSSFL